MKVDNHHKKNNRMLIQVVKKIKLLVITNLTRTHKK